MQKVTKKHSILKQILWGFRQYPEALSFITKNKLWWMFLVPAIFNVALIYFGFSAVNDVAEWAVNQIKSLIDFDGFSEQTTGFVEGFLEVTLWLVFKLMFFFLYAYIGGYVLILFLSPFLSWFSEIVERKNGGVLPKFSLADFFYNIFRGVVIALRSFGLQTLLSIVILALGLIPILNFAVPFLLLFVSAFFYGFAFVDYFLERRIKKINDSVAYIRNHKILTIALGLPFVFVLAIPYIGSFLAGFVTIIATVAATLSFMDEEQWLPTPEENSQNQLHD